MWKRFYLFKTHISFFNFPKPISNKTNKINWAKVSAVPCIIDGLFHVQPFNAMLFIVSPAMRTGKKLEMDLSHGACPSIGHTKPKNKFQLKQSKCMRKALSIWNSLVKKTKIYVKSLFLSFFKIYLINS